MYGGSIDHTQLAKMSVDEIFALTAGEYFFKIILYSVLNSVLAIFRGLALRALPDSQYFLVRHSCV